MVCQVRELSHVHGCPEWCNQYASDCEANMSNASTEDVATDCLTDDDEVPPMLSLERYSTVTQYNEDRLCEWPGDQSGANVYCPAQAIGFPPMQQFVCYMIPAPPSYSAPSGLDRAVSAPSGIEAFAGYTCPGHSACSQQHHFATEVPVQHACEALGGEEDTSDWSGRLLAGGEQSEQVLGALQGKVADLAFQKDGCRIVQDALQVASTDAARLIVNELHGYVQAAAWCPYANYVMQKVVEVVPPSLSGFVAHELLGVAGSVARGRYGCRILCRIFEHAADQPESRKLADELAREAGALCRHAFAHHVMEVILKHGLLEQRTSVVKALVAEFWTNVYSESASYVIESAIGHCTEEELTELGATISNGNHEWFVCLLNGKPGSRVLRAVARMRSQMWSNVLRAVLGKQQRFESQSALTWQGKRLVQELSKSASLAVTV